MYEFTDKGIAVINRRIQHEFATLRRSVMSFDEIWAIQEAVNTCYSNILRETKRVYQDLAADAYKTTSGRDSFFTMYWVDQFLMTYDPVTKYVFAHEYDRKRARLFEAIVSTRKKADIGKELKQAMYNLSVQTKQYADEVTDYCTLQGYKDSGIDKVRWITEQDGRVCLECKKRHLRVYPVDKVPDKPHIRCRCWFIPATDKVSSHT